MMKEEIKTQSWDEFFMRHVYLTSTKSKDPNTKIGAILVRDGIIISEGFNGFPRGVKDYKDRYDDRKLKYEYVVHAEENAIFNAARNGIKTTGSVMYTSGLPCNECAKSIIQAGVVKVIIHSKYPSMSEKWVESIKITRQMFKESGMIVGQFKKTLGLETVLSGNVVSV